MNRLPLALLLLALAAGLRFGSLKSGGGNLLLVSVATPLVRDSGIDKLLLVLGNSVGF